jgi:fatty acid desaturase
MTNTQLEVAAKKLGMLKDVTVPPLTFSVYFWGWSQYAVGIFVFFLSYFSLQQTWPGCLWSIPLGWGIYAIWMTGHDACHDSIFYSSQKLVNQFISFLCLDCLVVTTKNWTKFHHKEHHIYPNSSIDGQRLHGDYFILEFFHLVHLLLKYIWSDVYDVLSFNIQPLPLWPIAFVAQCWRLYFLYSLGPVGFPLTIITLVSLVAIMGLLTHSNQLQIPSSGWRQRQLQNTCDFLPGNWLAECISGGLNTHGVHHCLPSLPRGLHGWASLEMRKLEPLHYRGYQSIGQVFEFWLCRIDPPPLSSCPDPKTFYSEENVIQGRTDVKYVSSLYHFNKI